MMSASPGVLLALRMIWSGGWLDLDVSDAGALLPAAACSWEARAILLLAVPAFARALVLLVEVRRSLAMQHKAFLRAWAGSCGCWEDGSDSDGDGVGAAGAVPVPPGPRRRMGPARRRPGLAARGRRRGARRGGRGAAGVGAPPVLGRGGRHGLARRRVFGLAAGGAGADSRWRFEEQQKSGASNIYNGLAACQRVA